MLGHRCEWQYKCKIYRFFHFEMMFIFKAISPEELNMNHFYDTENRSGEKNAQRVP